MSEETNEVKDCPRGAGEGGRKERTAQGRARQSPSSTRERDQELQFLAINGTFRERKNSKFQGGMAATGPTLSRHYWMSGGRRLVRRRERWGAMKGRNQLGSMSILPGAF